MRRHRAEGACFQHDRNGQGPQSQYVPPARPLGSPLAGRGALPRGKRGREASEGGVNTGIPINATFKPGLNAELRNMTEINHDERPSVFESAKIEPKPTLLYDDEALITGYQVTAGEFSTWFDRKDLFEPNGNDFRIRIMKFGSAAPSGGARGGGGGVNAI